ncbi:MAG: hypothetical protein ACI9DO_002854 [Reinekea sp.]|jgi:hypothetical protein
MVVKPSPPLNVAGFKLGLSVVGQRQKVKCMVSIFVIQLVNVGLQFHHLTLLLVNIDNFM